MKKWIVYFWVMLICCVIFLMPGCIVINPPVPIATATQTQASQAPQATMLAPPPATPSPTPSSTLGAPPTAPPLVPLTVNTRQNIYSNAYMGVTIRCPEIVGMQDAMMQNGINDGVFSFLNHKASQLEAASIQSEQDYGAHAPYALDTSFEVMRNDGAILSILMNIMYYEGGAHPATELATINAVNSNPGDQLVLQDLFIPGTDYVSEINNEISAQIAADPATSGDYWFATIDANQTFCLTDTGLVILFEAYTIAPGAMGQPRFTIPYSNLPDLSNF